MNKCLRITFGGDAPDSFLTSFILKHARKLELEGTAQRVELGSQVRVVVCGDRANIDLFLDLLHKGTSSFSPEDVEVEPFLKDRDYRGVFRVIE